MKGNVKYSNVEEFALEIIKKFYNSGSSLYKLLVTHSKLVTEKALRVSEKVRHLNPDLEFIRVSAMLHDIGIFLTYEPELGCFGEKKYVCHGYLGRELLEKEGLFKHALVCERHVGVGISLDDIIKKNLPLPRRDMIPVSIEEKIICYADKFYSKKIGSMHEEKSIDTIRKEIERFGQDKLKRFDEWVEMFGD